MERIDQTIFNQLASKRAVILPNVGTLWVEFINAEQGGGVPSNKVGFSRDAHDGVETVIDLIHLDGVRYSEAEERYAEWLVASTSEQKLEIKDVGTITGNSFHVSKRLNELINPAHSGESVEDDEDDDDYDDDDYDDGDDDDDYGGGRRFSRNERTGMIIIALFVLILAGGWAWWWYAKSDRAGDKKESAVEQQVVAQAAEGEKSADEIAWAEETEAARKALEEQKPAIVPMQRFYVVGGVFSNRENANRYITETRRDYPHAKCNYQIQPFKGDKFMVSVHSSETASDAAAHRRRLSQEIDNYELWVYEVKPTK